MLYEKLLITLNEARLLIGKDPVEGGDVFADGSTPKERNRCNKRDIKDSEDKDSDSSNEKKSKQKENDIEKNEVKK